MAFLTDRKKQVKHIYTQCEQLKNIGLTSASNVKFIVTQTPFLNDEDPPSGLDSLTIKGRLLPTSEPYSQGSIPIRIVLGSTFPMEAPEVYCEMPMYHPNIEKNGLICLPLLYDKSLWNPTISLTHAITEITKLIDFPDAENPKNPEAAKHFLNDRKTYEQIVSELFKKHCSPRN